MATDRVEGSARRRSLVSLDLTASEKLWSAHNRKVEETSKKSKSGLDHSEAIALDEVEHGEGYDRLSEWIWTVVVLG
ncbi:hypothetical protein CRG98_015816 [Punica granatum]|uniref:Uncharacterized protein n=1 Tax=Punica granatum TaxID=22663 RepID=A0A2I0K5K9_PUNGR|nr:hypothetical protein CRG98_015816 [Punica granatum]